MGGLTSLIRALPPSLRMVTLGFEGCSQLSDDGVQLLVSKLMALPQLCMLGTNFRSTKVSAKLLETLAQWRPRPGTVEVKLKDTIDLASVCVPPQVASELEDETYGNYSLENVSRTD